MFAFSRHLGLALLAVGLGIAAPVTYTINFTTTLTSPPTEAPTPIGSFTYDPVSTVFTSFTVSFGGTLFDLTSLANNPSPNTPTMCGFGAPLTFNALVGSCPDGLVRWVGSHNVVLPVSMFRFRLASEPLNLGFIELEKTPIDLGRAFASGTAVASVADVPEPSTVTMVPLAWIAWWCLTRRKTPA